MQYTVKILGTEPALEPNWDAPAWASLDIAEATAFRPESHLADRPRTRVKLLASPLGLHGMFHVAGDRARCVRAGYGQEVWKDSCVEFFVQPVPGKGYFNFEFNCGGAFLASYVSDFRRTPSGGLAGATPLSAGTAALVRVRSTLPSKVDPQLAAPTDWTLAFQIPFAGFEPFIGLIRPAPGDKWKCNFYKCAEEVANPHWAAWSPVDELNFHLPRCFGELVFTSL